MSKKAFIYILFFVIIKASVTTGRKDYDSHKGDMNRNRKVTIV